MDTTIKNIIDSQKTVQSINKQKDIEQKLHNTSTDFKSMLNNAIAKNNDKPVDKKLMDVCIEMESLFVYQMLKEMRKTVHKENDLLYGGMAQEIFEDMLYNEYALQMSKTANFGLAKTLYEQLSQK
ncbi:MAG TPA: rod-binding protein [Spirochaetota bacterium]|nr:rod-binding protein [Spirochaetota bacterium]HOJ27753.1 rod-binding protein [Spirochaetota bacterium]HOM08927.1 rod-binding protein [Spirochaetota bacterium]HPP48723.1 rod-binding protein [Spirochaetota bacterium]